MSSIRIQHTKRIVQSLRNQITSLLVMYSETEEDSHQKDLEVLRERERNTMFTVNVVTSQREYFEQISQQLQLFRYELHFVTLDDVQKEIEKNKSEEQEDEHPIPVVYLIELDLLQSRFNQREAKELFGVNINLKM